MKTNTALLPLIIGTVLGASQVQAMPDFTQGNPLSKLGIKYTPKNVGIVVPDHENPYLIYVGPAAQKTIQGKFSYYGDLGPQCESLLQIQHSAYDNGKDGLHRESLFAQGTYYSNWYQLSFALPRKNVDRLAKIQQIEDEINQLGKGHIKQKTAYHANKDKWNHYHNELTKHEARLADLKNDKKERLAEIEELEQDANKECKKAFFDDTKAIKECMLKNYTKYSEIEKTVKKEIATDITSVKNDIKQQKNAINKIRDDYFKTKSEYEVIEDDLRLLEMKRDFGQKIFQMQLDVVSNAHNLELKVLEQEEGKVVGHATAGYNLYTDEVEVLSNLVAQKNHKYTVRPLDLFNVKLNSGITVTNLSAKLDNSSELYRKNVTTIPAHTWMHSSMLKEYTSPFTKGKAGEPVKMDFADVESFGAGAYNFHVTKAGYCAVKKEQVTNTYSAQTSSGKTITWKSRRSDLKPASKKISSFTQAIGLKYNFYAYPGLLRGDCSINVDRANSYFRQQGKKSSWRWFRKKNDSWDTMRKEAKNNLGMSCSLNIKPSGGSPEEAKIIAENFERTMYNDMWQMFVATYAKEYTIEEVSPNEVDLEKSKVGGNIGDGLMKICPANVYCQIANVVLKTLDEIGGAKAQGTTDHKSKEYGIISKHYDKKTWIVGHGQAQIDMDVKI